MVLSYEAKEEDIGRTVYSIMRRDMRVSATLTRKLKVAAAIRVSGIPVFSDYRLSPGETVTVDIAAAEPPCDNVPEHGSLDVLFENEGLLAVNKPVGMIVHPTHSKNTGTLANYVAGYFAIEFGIRNSEFGIDGGGRDCSEGAFRYGSPHVVNRLDRDTSGVVLFAKNSHMKALASAALADKSAVKEYLALVYGEMPVSGVMDSPIRRLEDRNMLRVASPDGQRAVTNFEMIQAFSMQGASLVRLRLETGRTHQIRVHCLHAGHPVLGDMLYCTEDSRKVSQNLGISTQALHAHKLAFIEPICGEYIEITAPTNFPCIFQNDMLPY